jgi:hypothetical protein
MVKRATFQRFSSQNHKIMKTNNKKGTTNQSNLTNCFVENTNLMNVMKTVNRKTQNINTFIGRATFIGDQHFTFSPDDPRPGSLRSTRQRGVAQRMSDGTFDFEAQPCRRAQSTLIRKLPHGRLSQTKDDAIQLTLKFYRRECINISGSLADEATEACIAIVRYQGQK